MINYDFNIRDKVKLKDGDGRIHIIESFEEDTFRNSIYIKVNFTDKSAIGCICKNKVNLSDYYTNIIKVE